MKILIACEFSGRVRDAFTARGFDATSCDILPSETPGKHIQDDVLAHLSDGWDCLIAHPPCTYLTSTGNRWFNAEFHDRFPNRAEDREKAVEFFMAMVNAPIEKIVVENPSGIMSTRYRPPDQTIQPYFFGDNFAKRTCLWLKNLPKLDPTVCLFPLTESVTFKSGKRMPKWYVEAASLPPHERMKARSKTSLLLADAMAQQWGDYLLSGGHS